MRRLPPAFLLFAGLAAAVALCGTEEPVPAPAEAPVATESAPPAAANPAAAPASDAPAQPVVPPAASEPAAPAPTPAPAPEAAPAAVQDRPAEPTAVQPPASAAPVPAAPASESTVPASPAPAPVVQEHPVESAPVQPPQPVAPAQPTPAPDTGAPAAAVKPTPAPVPAAAAAVVPPPVVTVPVTRPAGNELPADLLRPGDRLRFQIVEDGDPATELIIAQDGTVDAPYLGNFPAAGVTIEELARRLKAALEVDYYVTASVRLALQERPERSMNRGRVFVSGEVRRVGMVEIDKSDQNTAGKVILANGGLSDFADARQIKIFRTDATGKIETRQVDLRQVLEKGRIDLDVPIFDGDLIVVGRKLVNW